MSLSILIPSYLIIPSLTWLLPGYCGEKGADDRFVVVVCSLGNRPQGSNIMYTLWYVSDTHLLLDLLSSPQASSFDETLTDSIILFACCQGILLYCAGWTVYQTVPHTTEGWQDYQALFANRTFVQLALSLAVRLPKSSPLLFRVSFRQPPAP